MKDLCFYFEVLWNNRKILYAESFEPEFQDQCVRVTFGGLHSVSQVEIPVSARLKVELFGKGKSLDVFGLTVENRPLILLPSMQEIAHEFVATLGTEEGMGEHRILMGWCHDDHHFDDWKGLPPEIQDDWVGACRCWSKIPDGRRPLPSLELDGTHVVSKATFYCALGEAFLGSRGYLGSGLDGFKDCITHLDSSGHDKVLRIRNFHQVQRALAEVELPESNGKTYLESFLEILSESGYSLEIID